MEANGAPPGFTEIASPREALVDVYFGGEKIAEALIETKPGSIRFRTPSEIIAKLPRLPPPRRSKPLLRPIFHRTPARSA